MSHHLTQSTPKYHHHHHPIFPKQNQMTIHNQLYDIAWWDTISLESQSLLVRTHNPLSCDWLCGIPRLLNCEANDTIVATIWLGQHHSDTPLAPCAHWLAVVTHLYYAQSDNKLCTPTPWLCIATGSRLLVTR
jgi:hypothetical protein